MKQLGVNADGIVIGTSDQIQELSFSAESIRKRGLDGNIKSTIKVYWDGTAITNDHITIDDLDKRRRLLRDARKMSREFRTATGGEKENRDLFAIAHGEFDRFCRNIWDAHLEYVSPEIVIGDSTRARPEFTLEPHITKGGGTILFGDPGSGKSYVMLASLIAIDGNVNGIWKPQTTPALFINLERPPDTIARRISHVAEALGLHNEFPLHVLHARGRSLASVAPNIEKYIADNNIGVIGLDSISRSGVKASDEDEANQLMDLLNSFGLPWMAIGHVGHTDKTRVYGSMFFTASADLILRCRSSREGQTLGVHIDGVKANDIPEPAGMTLQMNFDEFGLRGISKGNLQDFPELFESVTGAALEISERLENYVLKKGKTCATDAARDLKADRSAISKILTSSSKYRMVDKSNGKSFYGIMA